MRYYVVGVDFTLHANGAKFENGQNGAHGINGRIYRFKMGFESALFSADARHVVRLNRRKLT